MLKQKPGSRHVRRSVLLLFSVLILVASVGSADGTVYATYYASGYKVLNGAHVAGSIPTSVLTVDSDYFIVRSSPSGTSAPAYNPSAYSLFGSTAYVSGAIGDIVSNNGVYMTFRSYAQSLYSHKETTIIGGETYNLTKLTGADAAGTTLSADAGATTGRKLMGKFVYQLTGLSSVPASTWTIYYRAYKGHSNVAAHGDIDVLIRMSNGTVRTSLATNVANSGALTNSWSTLSGTYSWVAYTVVDQTDYLEIDYYIEVTAIKAGYLVYLRIDDNTLAVADQTRATNICLLNEYAMEVEFAGSSNVYDWAQLVWSVDSSWTTDTVTVTLQLYNYTVGAYSTSGDGFISYTSSTTANTDETKTQTIMTNPQDFRDATGNWKIKVKGVKSTSTQFDFKADWIEFKPTYYTEYSVSTEFLFTSMTTSTPIQLDFIIVSQYNMAGVGVTIQVWNYSSLAYATSGQAYLQYINSGANETKLLSININPQFHTSNGNAKIKLTGVLSTTTQYQQETNQIKLLYSYDVANLPPVLDPIGPKSVNELERLNFTATASDPDTPSENLTFSLGPGPPTGASITANGAFTWTPTEDQGTGNYTIRVVVSDGALTDYEDVSVTVYEAHIHDVAVINVTASSTNVISGQVVIVAVVVKNQGTAMETFNVTVFRNETALGTKTVANLTSGNEVTLEFMWNTTGVAEATYRMRAVASMVPDEPNANNNAFEGAVIKVNTRTSSQPFDWVTVILYALPVIFGLLFLLFLLILKPRLKKKTEPRTGKKTDVFSQQYGMTHQQMIGKKMLLEIDPTSDYIRALSSFVSEAKNNNELLFILTSKNSTVHSYFSAASNAKFLLLASKTSSRQQINENETILPASDLSVMLDAFVRIQKSETEKTINILFDNLSDLILRCGHEKTYKFTRFLLEAISSPKTTALLVFNPMAHEPFISSSIRGLFQNQLAYAKSGPKTGTL